MTNTFLKRREEEEGAEDEKNQDCELSPPLLLSIRGQHDTDYQYTMILRGLHSCMHTDAGAHMLWLCHGRCVWLLGSVMCQLVCTEGSPVREPHQSGCDEHMTALWPSASRVMTVSKKMRSDTHKKKKTGGGVGPHSFYVETAQNSWTVVLQSLSARKRRPMMQ